MVLFSLSELTSGFSFPEGCPKVLKVKSGSGSHYETSSLMICYQVGSSNFTDSYRKARKDCKLNHFMPAIRLIFLVSFALVYIINF